MQFVNCKVLIMTLTDLSNYHIKKVTELENQLSYWRQQALSAKHRDEEL